MSEQKIQPPPKEPCRCAYFCMEDTGRTGRYCKNEYEAAKTNTGVKRSQRKGSEA